MIGLDNIRLQTTWNDAAQSINSNFAKILIELAKGGQGGSIHSDYLSDAEVVNRTLTITKSDGSLIIFTPTANDFTNEYKNRLDTLGVPVRWGGVYDALPAVMEAGTQIIITNGKEYISNGTAWVEMGDETAYALKTITINGYSLASNIVLGVQDIEGLQEALDEAGLWEKVGTVAVRPKGNLGIITESYISAQDSNPDASPVASSFDADKLWAYLNGTLTYDGEQPQTILSKFLPTLTMDKVFGLSDALDLKADKTALSSYLTIAAAQANYATKVELGAYLPLSGGTVTGVLRIESDEKSPLRINTTQDTNQITFYRNKTNIGSFGFGVGNAGNNVAYLTSAGNNVSLLLVTSGGQLNFQVDGVAKQVVHGHNLTNFISTTDSVGFVRSGGDISVGSDGLVSVLDSDKLGGQLPSYYATLSSLNVLSSAVSTLEGYFTGGVANNADKLDGYDSSHFATASALDSLLNTLSGTYTAWGQTFWENGKPKNVSGRIEIEKYGSAKLTTQLSSSLSFNRTNDYTGGANAGIYFRDPSGNTLAGYGAYTNATSLNYMWLGKSHEDNWMNIRNNGNVLIGTTSDNGGKLNVGGNITPSTSYAHTLGTSALTWEKGYIRRLDTAAGYYLRLMAGGVEYMNLNTDSAFIDMFKPLNVAGNITSTGAISAQSSDPNATVIGSSFNEDAMWLALDATGEVIGLSHIPTITNAKLSNSSMSLLGKTVALGGSLSVAEAKNALGLGSNAYTSTAYLPLSGGTITGTLYLASICEPNGNGMLAYGPNNWTGVSPSQWGLGALYSQGVIRSDNTDLIHYRYGNSTPARVILDAANYSSYALPLSGGTLASNAYTSLELYRNVGTNVKAGVGIRFSTNLGLLGVIAVSGDKNALFSDGTTEHTLIHSGNIGSQSVAESKALAQLYTFNSRPTSANINFHDGKVRYFLATSSMTTAKPPIGDSGILDLAWDNASFDMQMAFGNNERLAYRTQKADLSWNDWRELAFIDSNVASATKLQTARTLWGQSFDGTKDVSGSAEFLSFVSWNNANKDVRLQFAHNGEIARIYNITDDANAYKDLAIGQLENSDNGCLYFDASTERWGIGTVAPLSRLDVNGGILVREGIEIQGDGAFRGGILVDGYAEILSSLSVEGDLEVYGSTLLESLQVNGAASFNDGVAISADTIIQGELRVESNIKANNLHINVEDDNYGIFPHSDNHNQIGSSSLHWYRGYINYLYSDVESGGWGQTRAALTVKANGNADLASSILRMTNSDDTEIFSMEALNNGSVVAFRMSRSIKYYFRKNGVFEALGGVTSHGDIIAEGAVSAMGSNADSAVLSVGMVTLNLPSSDVTNGNAASYGLTQDIQSRIRSGAITRVKVGDSVYPVMFANSTIIMIGYNTYGTPDDGYVFWRIGGSGTYVNIIFNEF